MSEGKIDVFFLGYRTTTIFFSYLLNINVMLKFQFCYVKNKTQKIAPLHRHKS